MTGNPVSAGRRPSADDLLEALEDWLGGDLPARVTEADAFQLRIAANMLGLVRRELTQGEAAEARIAAALEAALPDPAAGGDPAARLCRALRAGEIAPDDAALLDALKAAAIERLAVDNPRYASYLRARARKP